MKMLDILEEYCQLRAFKVARIDGQTKGNDRQTAIDAFSREDSDCFIFLLSTRAGGLGINLTAADTVVIYDSDWNPQNDSQATARCHRIGQKQEVSVYRLLTQNTYEYEMFERASRKLAIESVVLDREKPAGTAGAAREDSVLPEESTISAVDSERIGGDDAMEIESVSLGEERSRLKDLPNDEEDSPRGESDDSRDTKATLEDDPSIATEKPEALCDYDIPETPVVVPKKHRGRKRTKQRTLEDELNPLRRSKNEVEEMLRRGLYKCVMEDADTDALDFDLDLDAILAGTHSVSTVSLFDVGHRAACCGSPRGPGQPACCRVSRGGRYDLHEAAVQSGSERVADRAERPRVLGENAEPSGRGHAVEATAGHALHGGPRAGAHVDARSGVLGERALRGAAGGQHERVRAARSGDRESNPRHRVRNAHRLRQEARAADVSLDRAARDAPLPPTHHQTTRFPRFYDSM